MRILFYLFALTLVLSLFFHFYPQIDLDVASYFYSAEHGFLPKNIPPLSWIYDSVKYAFFGLIALFVYILILINIFKRHPLKLTNLKVLFLAISLIVGPGLIVHDLFKDNWGRARPVQIEQFGGTAHFTPAWVISKNCEDNCSFVSGHAAMGFYFTAFAYVFARHRKIAISLALLYGGLESITRIIQGGHFLSDVILAGCIVIMVNHIIAMILFKDVRSLND